MRSLAHACVAATPGAILRPVADHGGASVRISRRGAFLANSLVSLRVPLRLFLPLSADRGSLLQKRRISSTFTDVIAESSVSIGSIVGSIFAPATGVRVRPRVPTRGSFRTWRGSAIWRNVSLDFGLRWIPGWRKDSRATRTLVVHRVAVR